MLGKTQPLSLGCFFLFGYVVFGCEYVEEDPGDDLNGEVRERMLEENITTRFMTGSIGKQTGGKGRF